MLKALIAGERDTEKLEMSRGLLRRKTPELKQALEGRVSDHPRFLLGELIEHWEFIESKRSRLEQEIEERLRPFEETVERLRTVPGIDRISAWGIVSEIGLEMGQFPDAAHLASWAGLCPGNWDSAGKRKSGRIRRGDAWLRRHLCPSAWGVSTKQNNYLSALFPRLAARRGVKRATIAVAHTLLVIIDHILKRPVEYRELGPDYFDKLNPERRRRRLVKRLEALGFRVALEATPQPAERPIFEGIMNEVVRRASSPYTLLLLSAKPKEHRVASIRLSRCSAGPLIPASKRLLRNRNLRSVLSSMERPPVRQAISMKALACFLLAILAFLYLSLFILPRTPIYLAEDPQIYLLNATRMLEGQVIYRDFFQFTPPGTESVYFLLFKLFSVRAWIPNVVLIFLGLGMAWVTIETSKRVVSGRAVFLPSFLFLTLGFCIWLSGSTHNWWSSLAVLVAILVIIEKRTPARLIGAAMLCGLASFFTQTRGAVAILGIAFFLVWECLRKGQPRRVLVKGVACLGLTFVVTVLAANVFFLREAGLERFLNCTVLFVIRHFPSDTLYNSLNAYTADLADLFFSPGEWLTYRLPVLGMWLFMHAIFPFVYVVFFMRYRREARVRPEEPWDRLMLLGIVGFFTFLSVAPAPSWFRLCSISPPALIILIWLVRSPRKLSRILGASLWVVALVLAVGESLERQADNAGQVDLPLGRTAFLNRDAYDKSLWLLQHTHPSDYFFRGVFTEYYFPLGLRNPAEVPYVTPNDYTRPEQVRNVVDSLEKHTVRFVFWSVWLDIPDDQHREGDHLQPLRAYLREHYHVVKLFPDDDYEQVWERNQ